jgi:mannose-6-phosphate isomerase-like protein (cupin superfamily)
MNLYARKSDAEKISEHEVSTFYEYPLDFKRMSVGVSEIDGEYPESGFDFDEEVEAVWYVVSGSGTVTTPEYTYQLAAEDMIKIPAKTRFKITGDKLKLVVVSSPPWWSEQHRHEE